MLTSRILIRPIPINAVQILFRSNMSTSSVKLDDGNGPSTSVLPNPSAAYNQSKVQKIPSLLYGTAWKGEITSSLVLQAFANGFQGVDVAGQRKHYREDLVGEAIAICEKDLGIKREEIWIQTKFTPLSGQDRSDIIPYKINARPKDAVRQSFESSLKNLHQGDQWDFAVGGGGNGKRRPWLDSYLLHSPLNTFEETLEAWETMEELVLEGKVRMIGFSNVYDARILDALRKSAKRIKPRILQNRWHHTSGHDVSLLSSLSPILSPNDFAQKNNDDDALTQTGGIVYQPFWTLTGNPRLIKSEPVQKAAERLGWTNEQVVYRFVHQGFGIPGLECVVLCGSTDEKHIHEAAIVVRGQDELNAKEVESIRQVIYGE